jgi:hypothetical protein
MFCLRIRLSSWLTGKYLLSVSVSRSEVVLWDLMKIEVVPESARVGVLEKIGIDWRMGQCPVT